MGRKGLALAMVSLLSLLARTQDAARDDGESWIRVASHCTLTSQ